MSQQIQGRKHASSRWAPWCALAALGVVILVGMPANYPQGAGGSEWKLQHDEGLALTAGFSAAKPPPGKHKALPPTGRPAVTLKPRAAKPLDAAAVNAAARPPEITVAKSGSAPVLDRRASKPSWNFLTRSVRRQIDAANISPRRWKVMVIHSSATPGGSAQALDYYHRQVKNMKHGLAYHFVIGNGHGAGDGEVEVGSRWSGQLAGGHLRSAAQNEVAIGICLIGSFEKAAPSRRQQEALDELIDYLQAKVGKIAVTTHRRINVRPTLCPGKQFPTGLFVEP